MEQAQAETVLHPHAIISELKKNNITHVVWLPDSETNFMYEQLLAEPSLDLVPVSREGETMAIAAGLWVGGKAARSPHPKHRHLRVRGLHSRPGIGRRPSLGNAHWIPGLGPARHQQRLCSQVHRAHNSRLGYQLLLGGNRRRRRPYHPGYE